MFFSVFEECVFCTDSIGEFCSLNVSAFDTLEYELERIKPKAFQSLK